VTLDQRIVAYPGPRRYRLAKRVEVVPLAELVGAGAGRRRLEPASARRETGGGRAAERSQTLATVLVLGARRWASR